VVGVLSAELHEPIDPAGRELQTDFNRWRLHVNSLGVLATHRRHGVGSALMQAVEEWGRARGAEVVILETETNNPTSVPFYEQRMGFSAQAFVYRKEIAG
jgi:ribosomal protein S18 acetylase RimI-like enzyme